jgi:hypothetical protein
VPGLHGVRLDDGERSLGRHIRTILFDWGLTPV